MVDSQTGTPRRRSSSTANTLEPDEILAWLTERREVISQQWAGEILVRVGSRSASHDALLERFCDFLCEILPEAFGPYRNEVEAIWLQVAELFGSVAAQRGLAAGEVIEEYQILRETLIRLLYVDPPRSGAAPMSLRDRLHLNRVVDAGVMRSSVGHTDAMFFALFQGSGVPGPLDGALVDEVNAQLDALKEELAEILSVEERSIVAHPADQAADVATP